MPINYDRTLERMFEAGRGKLKNSTALAEDLGVTPQALSNYKKRGWMPPELVIRFAEKHKLSIDWLIHGTEPAPPPELAELIAPALSSLQTETLNPDELVAVGKALQILRADGPLKLALKALLNSVGHEEAIHMELSALSPGFAEKAAEQIADSINNHGGRP